MKMEGPLRLLRWLLLLVAGAFIAAAAVDHYSSTHLISTAATNGQVLRLEGERVTLHLVRGQSSYVLLLLLLLSRLVGKGNATGGRDAGGKLQKRTAPCSLTPVHCAVSHRLGLA
jgi:hypothetical protein